MGAFEAINIDLVDETEQSGDLDDPCSTCNARKRIFSQSDVDFDTFGASKKLNPFSSALSAAPYYFHDFKKNDDK